MTKHRSSVISPRPSQLLPPPTLMMVTALLMMGGMVEAKEGSPTIDFGRDVRPILSDKCFRCHGPDEEEREAGLRLDVREVALESAIVPGDAASSEVIHRITTDDPDLRMPPADSGKTVSAEEVKVLQRWIDEGANWSEHWSFVKPIRPSVPPITNAIDHRWARNAIDHFTVRRLREAGLAPAPEAERTALLRRVTLDLTGLAPTPSEIAAFVKDARPDAYERVVERLIHSPRYGEHQARYWLDVARYGDTHGLHLDNERSIWPYRDWVIRAFNRNQPFDQFTIEQLAGDLLETPTREQQIATGFHRCNVTTSEGGSIDAEYLARYATDRVETTATAWLGLTAGCASCHDHKFDPISQREFYQLYAFFYSLSEKAMDGNALLPPPSITAPSPAQIAKQERLTHELDEIKSQLATVRQDATPQLAQWEANYRDQYVQPSPPQDMLIHCSFDEQTHSANVTSSETSDTQSVSFRTPAGDASGKVLGQLGWDTGKLGGGFRFDGKTEIQLGSHGDFERDQPFSVSAWVYLNGQGPADTIISKMDDAQANRGYDVYIGGGKLFVHLIHEWPNDAIRVNTVQPIYKQKWQQVCVTYDGSSQAAGVRIYLNGEEQELERTHDQLRGSIKTDEPLRLGKRSRSAPLNGSLDDLRLYPRVLSADERASLVGSEPMVEIANKPRESRNESEQRRLDDLLLTQHVPRYAQLLDQYNGLEARIRRIEGQFPKTLVMHEMEQPRQAHILVRGQYDQPGEAVSPGVPASLPSLPSEVPTNRLGLAKWLVSEDHPLTARVTVNRIWQQYFGTGIVATSEDFGSQGEWPSHPQLLDWLAVEFVASGWNVKALHRKIVYSATYRQSARATAEKLKRDPYNRLLSRGPRFRLDAESIRDNALAAGGLLVEQLGGRGVKPYQPGGLWEAVGYTSSNTARFKRDDGAALYRRSVYTFWKRTSPPPSMQILDAPSREVCTARRPRTNTAAAALLLMNDVQFVEAAQSLAHRVLRDMRQDNDAQRIERLFLLGTSRRPNATERSVLLGMLDQFRDNYQADEAAALALLGQGESKPLLSWSDPQLATRAAWVMLASTVLNLDETLNK